MASHLHLFEDQTDEDFFDKLVDDEFGIGEPSSGSVDGIKRGISNLSLGDVGTHVDDDVVGGVSDRGKEISRERSPDAVGSDVVSSEDGSSSVVPSDAHVFSEAVAETSPSAGGEVRSPDSSVEKGTLSKGTSVKVVQWSAFSTGTDQADLGGGFGSYSDFFPNGSAVSSDNTFAVHDVNPQDGGGQAFEEVNQQVTHTSSAEQHDGQQYNPDAADSQYWESLYPGWKFDYSTGQWYQVDNQEVEVSSNAQLGNHADKAVSSGLGTQDMTYNDGHFASGEVVSEQRAEASFLQQTAPTAAETIAESSIAGSVTDWTQGYPPNMVFDPQYPGWYYDTNTQQWYSLESYNQTLQMAASEDQGRVMGGGSAVLGGYALTQNDDFYASATNQFENQMTQSQMGFDAGASYPSQSAWQPVVADHTRSLDSLSPSQLIGNLSDSTFSPEKISEKHTVSEQTRPVDSWAENQMYGSFHDSNISMGNFTQTNISGSFSQQAAWKPGAMDRSRSLDNFENHMVGSSPDSTASVGKYSESHAATFQGFNPVENQSKFTHVRQMSQIQESSFSTSYYGNLNPPSLLQQSYHGANQPVQSENLSYSQFSTMSSEGRSSAGRPPHALVTFGFGGKLIVMKENIESLPYGSQVTGGKTISILNLMDVVTNSDNSGIGSHGCAYFDSLCKQSFPGPLVGGNAANKDLNKWIDERIAGCGSSSIHFEKSEHLRLILSLLKISFQHYGKLRSPFGTDPSVLETDGPESAVTKLFASVRENGSVPGDYGSFTHCMNNLPSEGQIRTTAVEVQHLLVSGKRKEALKCAQEGLLWGPALVLAAQLGEKFYIETVKKMAQYQFASGSPLRTLCLLIAGQPADVFSIDSHSNVFPGGAFASNQAVANGMLDSWEENLAIITANRTKDDELVMIHLGDCLWKERDEVIAAHTCYLVAEANFESYSDSARLCLVGADHWKCPRTYASPNAIQRTEFYEYSKVLGNSQFVLLPFQPYKLIYAHMLAEVGKVSDSLRYCQAILRLLKNSSRAPEAETWKQLASSLEERLKTHQQGGYGSNLAPAKLVGKLFTSIDKSISRMMGSPPPSLPPMPQSAIQTNGIDNLHVAPKVSSSQSTMAISSLIPSASEEKINEWTGDNRRIFHNRSVSEPDFGIKQVNSENAASADLQSKTSNAGAPSRFGRFGSQLFQKTIGWVARSRSDRQAKLGESNKFYYDEKLKRWVEEGAEPPAEETVPPPPPTVTSFQNSGSEYNINSALSQSLSSSERTEAKPSTSTEASSMPPIPPSTNQFSARGRMGVRSRYVDTFNKGGGSTAASFQSPSVPTLKPVTSAKFFVPAPIASSMSAGDVTETTAEASSNEDASSMVIKDSPYSSLSSSSSTHSMPRFPSVDNIAPMANKKVGMGLHGNGSIMAPARAASWSGSFSDALNHKMPEFKPSMDGFSATPPIPNNPSLSTGGLPRVNSGNLRDDLQEVEL